MEGYDHNLNLHETVQDYVRCGWSIVPIEHRTKRPPGVIGGKKFEWKPYQDRLPRDDETQRWFENSSGDIGCAVVLGPVSGHLGCRDFDDAKAYDEWASKYPERAHALPTVKTARGYHVYFRLSDSSSLKGQSIIKYDDGELRLAGGICLLPPSTHPSGIQYEWSIPPPPGDLREIDPCEIGLEGTLSHSSGDKDDIPRKISVGYRNTTLTQIAGTLRRTGLGQKAISVALQHENLERCNPPLPDHEVDSIARSIAKYATEVDSSSKADGKAVKEAAEDPHRLARSFINERCTDVRGDVMLRFWRHQWWKWSGTHYEVLDKEELRATLTAFVKNNLDQSMQSSKSKNGTRHVTHQLITNVLQALSGIVLLPFKTDQPMWVDDQPRQGTFLSMANGLLEVDRIVRDGKAYLHDHTPAWFSPHHLPYDFDPDAQCPQWLAFLAQIFEGDEERIALLQEWFGYCLLPDTSLQKFLVLEGEGSNGKSVVCAILTELLGRPNVSHIPLERFGDRFQLTSTLGKLANIASEVGELDKAAEGVLKAFTAGDRMSFDRKGLPVVEANPTARLVLATNNRPRFSDRSSALWRRMLLIPFRVCIPEDKQDAQLKNKLMEELPGIFGWAIAGLKRLRAGGRFSDSAISSSALEEYRKENNPARMFLSEMCEEDPKCSLPCATLYNHYKSWCESNGYRALGEKMFGKEVHRVFPDVQRSRKGPREEREYCYQGLQYPCVSYVS